MKEKEKYLVQQRYKNGFKWCGKCGEWHKVAITEPQIVLHRCPWCNYVLRKDALLKAQRRPHEVHRY